MNVPVMVGRGHEQAVALLKRHGMGIVYRRPSETPEYTWNGRALTVCRATDEDVLFHELAHYLIACPSRRILPEYGLGPSFEVTNRDARSRLSLAFRDHEEELASLLGVAMAFHHSVEVDWWSVMDDHNWTMGIESRDSFDWTWVFYPISIGMELEQRGLLKDGRPVLEV